MATSVSLDTNRRSNRGRSKDGAKIVALRGEVWKKDDFLEIEAVIGSDKAHKLLSSFASRLDDVSLALRLGSLNGQQIRVTAHDLTGISGQLGFKALQHLCTRMMVVDDDGPAPREIAIWIDVIQSSMRAAETYFALRALLNSAEIR